MPSAATSPESGSKLNPASGLATDLALGLRLADAADAVSLAGFKNRAFSVSRKADNTEVTEIDRATESAIRTIIGVERPEHCIYGEEYGVSGDGDAPYQWVLDPIDGTTNFVRGVPVWATLIALVYRGTPVLGVTDSSPTPAQKLLIEALKAAWRDEESRDVIIPQIAGLLAQYENTIRQGMAEGAISTDLDAQLLARLFMAFPIGLSMLTLAGLPDPDPASFIPFFQRFGETLKPHDA